VIARGALVIVFAEVVVRFSWEIILGKQLRAYRFLWTGTVWSLPTETAKIRSTEWAQVYAARQLIYRDRLRLRIAPIFHHGMLDSALSNPVVDECDLELECE